ncbi:MAG: hypothetical protein SVR94_19115, partial [Pseudomonadota bacterium]|nr:hypothetical protein [Pseudomonadota bacterium]
QATSDGQCVPLLKKYEIENKVIANRAYFFPAQYEAFILNKSPGVETIYFVASREADDLFGKTYSFCNRLTSADEHSLSRNYHGIECNLDCLKKVTFKHKPQKEEER